MRTASVSAMFTHEATYSQRRSRGRDLELVQTVPQDALDVCQEALQARRLAAIGLSVESPLRDGVFEDVARVVRDICLLSRRVVTLA